MKNKTGIKALNKTKTIKVTSSEEMLEASVKELQFANLQVKYLLSVLYEVEEMTTDKLAWHVIGNRIQRHTLDKLIHARILIHAEELVKNNR